MGKPALIPMTPFARRVREARVALGMTRKEVAAAVGISASHMGVIEHGSSVPSAAILHSLARLYGTTMDALWGGHAPESWGTRHSLIRGSHPRENADGQEGREAGEAEPAIADRGAEGRA